MPSMAAVFFVDKPMTIALRTSGRYLSLNLLGRLAGLTGDEATFGLVFAEPFAFSSPAVGSGKE